MIRFKRLLGHLYALHPHPMHHLNIMFFVSSHECDTVIKVVLLNPIQHHVFGVSGNDVGVSQGFTSK